MAQYEVTGLDKNGKEVKLRVEAESVKAARTKARADGLTPVSVLTAEAAAVESANSTSASLKKITSRGIKSEERSNMTRQLATLVKAHVPIVESLTALVEQIDNVQLKNVLMEIRQHVKEGHSLGDSFAAHPELFNRVYVNMVKAGESSGRLDVVLMRLADFGENQEKLKSKVMGALLYPMIMVVVGFLVLIVIFVKVVPQITKIFVDMKATLPTPTRILIGISDFMQAWGTTSAVALLVGLVLFERYLKTATGRAWKDQKMLTGPIVGTLMRKLCVARFARTLGTLLSSGVPMIAALQITKNVVDNAVFEDALEKTSVSVSEGRGLAVTLKSTGEFPPIVTHMVGVGEKSGELEPMLLNIAENYEHQVEASLSGLTSVLEPVMMVVMAVLVGFIVMGVLMPIFEMNNFGG